MKGFGDNDRTKKKAIEKKISSFLELVKNQESLGYAYDGAEASFELLSRRTFQNFKEFYSLETFKVSDEKIKNEKGEFTPFSEARVKIFVGKKETFLFFKKSSI